MARSVYGGRPGDTVASIFSIGSNRKVIGLPVDGNGDPYAVPLQVWDEPGGTRLTDLRASDGTTPITVVTASATTGQIPEFYAPDGYNVSVYLKDPDGDYQRMDARADAAADAAAAAQAAAEAAAASIERDEPGGVAPLDEDSKVPDDNLPDRLSASGLSTSIDARAAQQKTWARSPDAMFSGAVTRDGNGAPTSAAVVWPDGATGTYTADTLSTTSLGAVDAYHVTRVTTAGTTTYTQTAVARDAYGNVVNLPDITVA